VWFKSGTATVDLFGLSVEAVRSGHVWTLLTYGLLHGSVTDFGVLHVGLNMLALVMLAQEVVPAVGERRFAWFYAGSIVASGLFWLAVAWPVQTWLFPPGAGHPAPLVVGASGAVSAVLALWACVAVDQPRTFLLFFLIPVSVRPRHFAWGLLAFSVFGMLFLELPGVQPVAHSSHIGGMLAGWLYFRLILRVRGGSTDADAEPAVELPHWMRKRKVRAAAGGSYKVNVAAPPPQDIRAEVDRILDKINSLGFGSLTDEERRLLDDAKDLLNRR
jgi:membrane associated rhomboid family serine protease